MMFLKSCRCRASVYSRLQIAVSGAPMMLMSSRNFDGGRGFVESKNRYPPGSISATSSSQVSGFIATIISTPPRRPRWPLSLIRTSYQVGRPWMFDGKMLRELAGIPIRRIDLANSELALAEPDPFTLANLTTKSLTLWIAALRSFDFVAIGSELVKRHRATVIP